MAQLVATFLLFFLLFNPVSCRRGSLISGRRKPPPRGSSSKDLLNSVPSRNTGPAAGLQAQLLYSGDWDYVLQLGVGTPASNVSLIVDTADDFIWSDCLQSNVQGSASAYYPDKSSTFIKPPCNNPQWGEQLQEESCDQLPGCRYNCSDDEVAGVLANDTFVLGAAATDPRNISFACNDVALYDYNDTSGYVGVGRGPLSLISQLKLSKFSHCFTDQSADNPLSSYMFFGSYADLDGSIAVNTTSLANDSSGYVLDLKGISVGTKLLPIRPEALQYVRDSNGTIIYTMDSVTYLPPGAYKILSDEVKSHVDLPLYNKSSENFELDLCFNRTSDGPLNLSTITFHFDGADMTLPTENFMVDDTDDNGTSVVCLMMMPYDDGYSYLGNYQMQNFQFIYDLKNQKLSFRSTQCDQLQPHKSPAVKLDLHKTTLALILLLYLLLA